MGFFQGLIGQYALPILEKQSVWITNVSGDNSISYIDTQDVAKICIRSLILDKVTNQTFTLGGSKAWSSLDIIKLCEKFSGQSASVASTPLLVLKFAHLKKFLFGLLSLVKLNLNQLTGRFAEKEIYIIIT